MTVFQKIIQKYSIGAVGENFPVKGTPLFAGQMEGVEAAELIAPNQLWCCGLGAGGQLDIPHTTGDITLVFQKVPSEGS